MRFCFSFESFSNLVYAFVSWVRAHLKRARFMLLTLLNSPNTGISISASPKASRAKDFALGFSVVPETLSTTRRYKSRAHLESGSCQIRGRSWKAALGLLAWWRTLIILLSIIALVTLIMRMELGTEGCIPSGYDLRNGPPVWLWIKGLYHCFHYFLWLL